MLDHLIGALSRDLDVRVTGHKAATSSQDLNRLRPRFDTTRDQQANIASVYREDGSAPMPWMISRTDLAFDYLHSIFRHGLIEICPSARPNIATLRSREV